MIQSIEKPKIPSRYGYILKTEQLENAVINNSINIHIDLVYWVPQIIGSILEAHYWLPNANVPYSRLYIRAGVLEKEKISLAREMMTRIVLPEFILETKKILELSDNSPLLKADRYFEAIFNNDKIIINSKNHR